jgi:hypothetical protein
MKSESYERQVFDTIISIMRELPEMIQAVFSILANVGGSLQSLG